MTAAVAAEVAAAAWMCVRTHVLRMVLSLVGAKPTSAVVVVLGAATHTMLWRTRAHRRRAARTMVSPGAAVVGRRQCWLHGVVCAPAC